MVYGVPAQSCDGLGGICEGESCCSSIYVSGGLFEMGRSETGADSCAYGCGADELPEHEATVSAFYLDKFEVTVGRFRKFVDAYDGSLPASGAGKNPHATGSGWQTSFNSFVAASDDEFRSVLLCDNDSPSVNVWTDAPGPNDARPMNCVRWYEAFAFCIWDGGRLPTEAEWEFVAAAGSENRLYPWGDTDPFGIADYSTFQMAEPVGSYPLGASLLGHRDMAGGVSEFVLDCYASDWYSPATCNDCANLTPGSPEVRVFRGGSTTTGKDALRAASRQYTGPTIRRESTGIRCARDVAP